MPKRSINASPCLFNFENYSHLLDNDIGSHYQQGKSPRAAFIISGNCFVRSPRPVLSQHPGGYSDGIGLPALSLCHATGPSSGADGAYRFHVGFFRRDLPAGFKAGGFSHNGFVAGAVDRDHALDLCGIRRCDDFGPFAVFL